MCQILVMAGIKRYSAATRLTIAVQEIMAETERDGFGFATLGIEGNAWGIHGAKWVDPADAWTPPEKKIAPYTHELSDIIVGKGRESAKIQVGIQRLRPRALLAHGRFATCGISLSNTHPFIDARNKTVLVHNGVISNHETLEKKFSSCDSEAILTAYIKEDIAITPERIQTMVDKLNGSFACGVMAFDGFQWVVDIFKNSQCSLYVAYFPRIGCFVFTTKDTTLQKAAKRAKLRHGPIVEVQSNTFLRLSAVSGKRLFVGSFNHEVKYETQSIKELINSYNMEKFGLAANKDMPEPYVSPLERDVVGDKYTEDYGG